MGNDKVDEHVYRKMEEICFRLGVLQKSVARVTDNVETLQKSVARLVDIQVMMGYNLDRLRHTDGATSDGPVLDPED